jgi:hypothetical protein
MCNVGTAGGGKALGHVSRNKHLYGQYVRGPVKWAFLANRLLISQVEWLMSQEDENFQVK